MTLEESVKLTVEGCGVQLYDISTTKEHSDNIFRVYISSPDGISLDKCAEVSRLLSPLLDVDEPMNGKYKLEVSSPGISRKLKSLNHFICSIGESIRIKKFSTDIVKGVLIEAKEDGTLTLKDKDDNIETLTYDDVLSASAYFEWKN